jgi:uncharacterized protein (AIM24 family)
MATYVCRFCRTSSDPTGASCPSCGAPLDVRELTSDSGWEEQPPVRDMAKISFGGSTCQIEGTTVPVADFGLKDRDGIFFSHHSVLWADTGVTMQAMPMAGGWSRVRAGLPLVMLTAQGPGHVALSEDSPGEVVGIPLRQGQEIVVREHRFFAATSNVNYTWHQSGIWYTTQSGNDQEYHYPVGLNVDVFGAASGNGLLLLHAPGNVFIRDLGPREPICIQPTSLLYKDASVGMALHLEYPNAAGSAWRSGFSYRQVWLRLWGPGRVAVQSVYERPEESQAITSSSQATVTRW